MSNDIITISLTLFIQCNKIKTLLIKPKMGFGAIAFFVDSVMGSCSTVCVSALTPNAVDKITSMVRL